MKKIVLALVVAVVACVVVFASQDVKCRQAAVYSSFEQVTPENRYAKPPTCRITDNGNLFFL